MPTRVVVTGAQGFLGRFLVADWLAAEPEVTIVGIGRSTRLDEHFTHDVGWAEFRVPAPLPAFLAGMLRSKRYRYFSLDMTDLSSLTQFLAGTRPDIVVHLAASLRDDPPTQLVHTNMGAVASLFESVSKVPLGPARIVLGSSGSVYGYIAGRVPPFHEDAACAPIDPYSVTKSAAESLSRILAQQHGLSVLWARIFNLVGPGQHERHLCGWLGRQVAAIADGVQPSVVSVGPLNTTRDFIDVRDAAKAIRLIATKGQAGTTYNVASGRETSGRQVLDTLLGLAGLTGRVLIKRRPDRAAEIDRHYADIARLAALGFSSQYSLGDSLTHVLEYYRTDVVHALATHRAAVRDDT